MLGPAGQLVSAGYQGSVQVWSRKRGRVQLWDLGKNCLRHTFRGHEGNVTDLRFAPDGRTLISASTDSTLLVWDLTRLPN